MTGHLTIASEEAVKEKLVEDHPRNWGDIITNPEQHKLLLWIGRRYEDLLRKVIKNYFALEYFEDVVCLLDFDVIRDFLERQRSAEFERFAIDSFFFNSRQPYAIPYGAFLELVNYLRSRSNLAHKLPDIQRESLNREDAIRAIGKSLRVLKSPKRHSNEVLVDVIEQLDKEIIALQRLLYILDDDERFLGVIADYDKNDSDAVFNILSQITRGRGRDAYRDQRDGRDAFNIAIAIKRSRNARLERKLDVSAAPQGYILISLTKPVINLPWLLSLYEHGDLLEELCFIMNVDPDEPAMEEILAECYNVMDPMQILTLEELGFFDNRSGAFFEASANLENIRKINASLEKWKALEKSVTLAELRTEAMKTRLETEEKLIRDSLSNLRNGISSNMNPNIIRLEERRAAMVSNEYAQLKQTGSTPSALMIMEQKSTELLRLLDEIYVSFTEKNLFDHFEYECCLSERYPFEEISSFEIIQKPSFYERPHMTGDIFYAQDNGTRRPSHYVLRWRVYCDEEAFFEALSSIIRSSDQSSEALNVEATCFTRIASSDEPFWEEGVLVYTEHGIWGLPLEPFLQNGRWKDLHLNKLGPIIINLASPDSESTLEERLARYGIKQYRVNTPIGDFLFDVYPPKEGKTFRYFSIISHCDMSSHISYLHKQTRINFVYSPKLAQTIAEVTSNFQALPPDYLVETI